MNQGGFSHSSADGRGTRSAPRSGWVSFGAYRSTQGDVYPVRGVAWISESGKPTIVQFAVEEHENALRWAMHYGRLQAQSQPFGINVHGRQPTAFQQPFPNSSMRGIGPSRSQVDVRAMPPPSRTNEPTNLMYMGIMSSAGSLPNMSAHRNDIPRAPGYTAPGAPTPENADMMDWTSEGQPASAEYAPGMIPPSVVDVEAYLNSTGRYDEHSPWPTPAIPWTARRSRRGSLDSVLSGRTGASDRSAVYLFGGNGSGLALTKRNLQMLWGGGQNAPSTPSTTDRHLSPAGAIPSPSNRQAILPSRVPRPGEGQMRAPSTHYPPYNPPFT